MTALAAEALVVCNPYPPEGFPADAYATLVGDVRAAGIPVVVDLSTRGLTRRCRTADLVKINDWELASMSAAQSTVRGRWRQSIGCSPLVRAGRDHARRGSDPGCHRDGTALRDRAAISPGRPPRGMRRLYDRPVAAGLAQEMVLGDALVLGAAAGSANFLRHGLGTGRRATVEELRDRVTVRAHDAPRV